MLKCGVRFSLLVSGLVCLLSIAGCGSKRGSVVTGKLVLPDGLKLTSNDSGSVALMPEQDSAKPSGTKAPGGTINPNDLSFTINDAPPGDYKVVVTLTPYPGQADPKHAKSLKNLSDRYSIESSKMTYKVTSDSEQKITVNLVEGKVTKQ
jgi:hypothetical protein